MTSTIRPFLHRTARGLPRLALVGASDDRKEFGNAPLHRGIRRLRGDVAATVGAER